MSKVESISCSLVGLLHQVEHQLFFVVNGSNRCLEVSC